ncbi:MAG: energy transducer TonB [Saprospiraceae bacterium]|nr:energy transducer TonB [Saprospiraceae bacterium]
MVLFEIAIPGLPLVLIVGGIVVVIAALIILYRRYLSNKNDGTLTERYKEKEWSSPLKARNKYPDVDILNMSGSFWQIGLLLSLGLILLAFNWTSYDDEIFIPEDALFLEEEIEIEPPRTAEPPPPPPPPPPPVIEEVPDEEMIEEEPEFLDQDIEEETILEPEPIEETPPPPPPPPPKEEPEEIFRIVEQMPRFPGCENKGSKAEKDQCAQQKLLEFIYANIKYPAIARENGVEGTVVVQFVVEKNGKVTDVNVVRDIGAGCGEEAKRVVNLMNSEGKRWTPGKQRGRPVRVQFTLPVKFQLQ